MIDINNIYVMKENGFTLKRKKDKKQSIQKKTPTQAESLLRNPEQAARGHWPPCECRQNGVHVF